MNASSLYCDVMKEDRKKSFVGIASEAKRDPDEEHRRQIPLYIETSPLR